ncbi:hypothetical protein B0H17DRAFT_1139513 [Mycena rosella]|uniref:Zn(2)-C6 fungal-type domain-containing protein n=1 Tax=Mycena rosella TaxID=1033263 RepID=A0AAD7D7R0_MYCRO|nr:hypothetical protein B0H17DRAFT_1139513 [Mycena rosella]
MSSAASSSNISGLSSQAPGSQSSGRRRRAKATCFNCRKRKCVNSEDPRYPCARCRRRGLSCEYLPEEGVAEARFSASPSRFYGPPSLPPPPYGYGDSHWTSNFYPFQLPPPPSVHPPPLPPGPPPAIVPPVPPGNYPPRLPGPAPWTSTSSGGPPLSPIAHLSAVAFHSRPSDFGSLTADGPFFQVPTGIDELPNVTSTTSQIQYDTYQQQAGRNRDEDLFNLRSDEANSPDAGVLHSNKQRKVQVARLESNSSDGEGGHQSPSVTLLPPARRRALIVCTNCRRGKIKARPTNPRRVLQLTYPSAIQCISENPGDGDPCAHCTRRRLVCDYVAEGEESYAKHNSSSPNYLYALPQVNYLYAPRQVFLSSLQPLPSEDFRGVPAGDSEEECADENAGKIVKKNCSVY